MGKGFKVAKSSSINQIDQSIVFITSADVRKCLYRNPTLNIKDQICRYRSTVARKNSVERQEPRKKPREEPGSEEWPVFFWLCWVEIIRIHGH